MVKCGLNGVKNEHLFARQGRKADPQTDGSAARLSSSGPAPQILYRCFHRPVRQHFLCSLLWRTGVLGAPAEYWNYRSRPGCKADRNSDDGASQRFVAGRLSQKLLACRTSKNGVFGVKAHSFDFKEAIRKFPKLLDLLAPVTYIYIQRQDKVAQAVSMAKAAQTGAWVARADANTENLNYDRDLIAKCLSFLERQDLDWRQWFETNHIEPFVVTYENLTPTRPAWSAASLNIWGSRMASVRRSILLL